MPPTDPLTVLPLAELIQAHWLAARLAERRRCAREDATPLPLRVTIADAPTVAQPKPTER